MENEDKKELLVNSLKIEDNLLRMKLILGFYDVCKQHSKRKDFLPSKTS